MRELPVLWGEAGTRNVDHLKPLKFQDTLLKLRSVSLHPFTKLLPWIIMLLKLSLHFSAVWHPQFLFPGVVQFACCLSTHKPDGKAFIG